MPYITKEATMISRLELVLPQNVLQACISLQKGFSAEFLSTNIKKRTTSRIKVAKEIDESVRLIVAVSKLQAEDSNRPKNIMTPDLKEKLSKTVSPSPQELEGEDITDKVISVDSLQLAQQNDNGSVSVKAKNLTPKISSQDITTDVLSSSPVGEQQTQQSEEDKAAETRAVLTVADSMLSRQSAKELDNRGIASSLPECEISHIDLATLSSGNILESIGETELRKNPEEWKKETAMKVAGCAEVELLDRTGCNEKPENAEIKPCSDHIDQFVKCDEPIQTRSMLTQGQCNSRNNIECDDAVDTDGNGEKIVLTPKQTSNPTGTAKWTSKTDRSSMKRPHYKREQNVQCSFCPAKLKDVDSLFDHAKLKHVQAKGYKELVNQLKETMKVTCVVCNKVYSRREQLAIHTNLVHTLVKRVDCPKCSIRVKSERHLKDHMRRIHKNTERVYLCHLCPASFKVPAYLSAHLKYVHTNNKEDAFPCDECEKTYSSEKYLRNHKMRVHMSKRHVCGVCGKAFSTHPNLRRHIMLLHEKKGDKPFQCEICGRRFTLKANWKDHVNTLHLNAYSLQCSICKLGFRRKKDLKTHEVHAHGSTGYSITGLRQLTQNANDPITVIPICPAPPVCANVDLRPEFVGSRDQNAQYIMATPEILQAFGIQLGLGMGATETESKKQSETSEKRPVVSISEQPSVQESMDVETTEEIADIADAPKTLTTLSDMDLTI